MSNQVCEIVDIGTGLGLSIARRIAHSGDISILASCPQTGGLTSP